MSNLPLHRLRCALLLTAVTSLVLLAVLNTAVRAAQRWAQYDRDGGPRNLPVGCPKWAEAPR